MEEQLKADYERIAQGEDVRGLNEGGTKGRACGVEWRLDAPSTAIRFDEDCIRCVEESTEDLLGDEAAGSMQRMISGAGETSSPSSSEKKTGDPWVAGHDSVFTSKRVPTSMIFVPCRDGVSHNPAEYCAPEDCANGAQVLLGAVLRYDRLRAQRRGS